MYLKREVEEATFAVDALWLVEIFSQRDKKLEIFMPARKNKRKAV